MLAEYVHGLKEMRDGWEAREKEGPIQFVFFTLQILDKLGFSAIQETPPVKHLTGYLWDLVRRYETREIDWGTFEDQVERWQLVMVNKIDAAKAAAHV